MPAAIRFSLSLFITLLVSSLGHADNLVFMRESKSAKEVYLADSTRIQNAAKVVTPFTFNIYPDISRDGHLIAFVGGANETSLDIFVKDLKTNGLERVTQTTGFYLHPTFSGDARWLAYSGQTPGQRANILVLNRVTQEKLTLSEVGGDLYFPALSSNGAFIVYQRSVNREERAVYFKRLGGDEEALRISTNFDNCMAPALSFDDFKVAYTCKDNGHWRIFVYDRLTHEILPVTAADVDSYAPTFDRFGHIYFSSNQAGSYQLYFAKSPAAGAAWDITKVTNIVGDLYAPSLSGEVHIEQNFLTNIPAPARSSFGTLIYQNKAYLFGGHQGPEHTYPEESFLDRVDIYDLKTGLWSEGAPRPVKSHGYNVAVCGGQIYAFGGFAFSPQYKPSWKSLSRIDKYNPLTNSWLPVKATLAQPRSSYVLGEVSGRVYLLGGWDSTPQFENDFDGRFQRSVEIFDCATERFVANKLALPDPLRRAFTGVVKDGKIYLLGGLGVGATHFELLDNVTTFDTTNLTFTELAPLPFATFAPAAGFLGENLYILGGMFKYGGFDYDYVNHIYRMKNSVWENTGRTLHESKGFSMTVPYENSLLVMGGHSYANGADSPVPTVETLREVRTHFR